VRAKGEFQDDGVVGVSGCDVVEAGGSDDSEDDRVARVLFWCLGMSRRVAPARDGDDAAEAGERVIRSIVSRREGKSWASRRGSPVI
jgi:hypothetical protein